MCLPSSLPRFDLPSCLVEIYPNVSELSSPFVNSCRSSRALSSRLRFVQAITQDLRCTSTVGRSSLLIQ